MVSPPAPTFPSESLDIPPITPQTSNPSLLRFSSDHIQNSTLPNSIRTQQLQNIQNTTNMLTESVSHFTDHTIDENTDLVEGPLDKIVDQIMDRELNEAIMKTSTLSNTFGQHPTFTNTPSQVPSSCAGSFQHGVGGHDTTNSIPATQSGSTQTVQKNLPAHSQSQFTLQPPGSVSSKVVRSLAQASVAGLTQNRSQQKAGALQNVNKIEELLNLQESASSSTSKVEQKQFLNQLSKPAQTSFSSANPANNGVSTASRGNINLTLPLDIKILQSQTQTNSQNELNRTQNNNPQKLAFVTSVGTSSSTNSASQIIKSQGLNIQRSLAKQGTGILSSVHETSSQNISRTGSQADVSNMQALLQTLARTPGLLSNSNQSLSKTGINNLPSQLGTSLPTVAGTKPNLMQGSVTTKTNQRDNFSIFKETSSSSNPSNSLPTHLGKSQSTVSVTKSSLMQGNVTPKTSQLTSFSIFNEESTSANSSNSLASHLGTSQSTMSGTNSSLTQGTMTPNTSQLNKNFSIFTEAGSSSIPTNSMTSHLDALQPAVSTTKPNLTQGSTTPDTIRLNKNFSIFTEANTSTKLSDSMIAHLDTLQSTISATKPNLTQGNMVPDTSQLKNFSIFTGANTSTNPSTNTKSHLSTSQANVSATNSNLTQGTMNHNTSQLNKNFPIFTETSSVNKSSNNMSSHLGTSQPTFSATKPNLTQGIINQILQSIPKQTGSEPSTALISNQTLPAVALAQSIATTSLKITSPSANISSTFQLQISEPSQNVSSLQGTIFSQASPRLSTSNGQSVTPTSSNMHVFSKYQLSQPKVSGIVSKTSGTSSMMFTLSPGSQGATTLKALSVAGKDKLAGRQIFLLQQPRQMLKNPKQQPVKIIFVNDGSVRQVVSGPQKSNAGSSSTAMASKQSPVQAEVQRPSKWLTVFKKFG